MDILWPKDYGGFQEAYTNDVVLVHGLAGDSISTWTHSSGIFWPTDLLPTSLSGTRVLSYSYGVSNACVDGKSGRGKTRERLLTFAEALCNDLADVRLDMHHPITFIGHGVGGIVVKNALVYAHNQKKNYRSLIEETRHVIFMDTPHRGFDTDTWKVIFGDSLNDHGCQQFRTWSSILTDLLRSFPSISEKFAITSTFAVRNEDRCEDDERVPIQESSAVLDLPNERTYASDASHSTMCKFGSVNDVGFRRLILRINAVNKSPTVVDNEEYYIMKIRKWIQGKNYMHGHTHMRNQEKRHPGTCEWLFKSQMFQKWVSDDSNTVLGLWLHGKAGAGKSTLCSAAVQYVEEAIRKPTVFFFLDAQSHPSDLQLLRDFACRLLDILAKCTGTSTMALRHFLKLDQNDLRNVRDMVDELLAIVGRVFVFIDGLDEVGGTRLTTAKSDAKIECSAVEVFLKSLLSEATGEKSRVRLWCSSQNADPATKWMEFPGFNKLPVDEGAVAADVHDFISHGMNEKLRHAGESPEVLMAVLALHAKAKGNFHWASLMIDSVSNCADDEDMVMRAVRGLPGDLNTYYEKCLERLNEKDADDARESGRATHLSRAIISIVTFANRNLDLDELQEAITASRGFDVSQDTWGSKDLSFIRFSRSVLRERCQPLVEFISTSSNDPDEGILRLSHGSVRTFLIDRHIQAEDAGPGTCARSFCIDPSALAIGCLRYLFQRRYSQLLVKKSSSRFLTSGKNGEDVSHHHFLRYCAKYWYRHLEEIEPTGVYFKMVRSFLVSPQFVTCLQVQSLFVVGHFVQNLDAEVGHRRFVKKNLPGWLRDFDEEDSLNLHYKRFIGEWGTLLQLGITEFQNGEVDRCFWGALGPESFLSANRRLERYRSFQFTPKASSPGQGFYEAVCDSGSRLMVCKVSTSSENEESPAQIECHHWSIDGSSYPTLEKTTTMSVDKFQTNWHLYLNSVSRDYPLIPASTSAERPDLIAPVLCGDSMRIGSLIFGLSDGQPRTNGLARKISTASPYWESIVARGPFIVKSRRRLILPLPEVSTKKHKLATTDIRPDYNPERSSDSERSWHDSSSDYLQGESSSDFDELSSPEEYWTVASSNEDADLDSPFDEDESQDSDPEMPDYVSDETDHSDESVSTSFLNKSDSDSEGSDSEPHPVTDVDPSSVCLTDTSTTSDDSDVENDYPKVLGHSRGRTDCDACGKRNVKEYYQCIPCGGRSSFDICKPCIETGQWCRKSCHQMVHVIVDRGVHIRQEKVTINDCCPSQFVLAEKIDSDGRSTAIFRFMDSTSAILYDSPPAIHPTKPLMVWPLGHNKLLFADLGYNAFFKRKIRPLTAQHKYISVQLKFSPCGRLLHVASFQAILTPDAGVANRKPRIALYFHISTNRLSSGKATCSPPKLLFQQRLALGVMEQDCVRRLPFTLTWNNTAVYIAAKSRQLQIYRVSLDIPDGVETLPAGRVFGDQTQRKHNNASEARVKGDKSNTDSHRFSPACIRMSGHDIALPRSTGNRTVRFFPDVKGSGNSVVIIGSQHCEVPAPPIGIYLCDKDVGGWIPVDESRAAQDTECSRRRHDPLFETFDARTDCDLIPYDTDFSL